MSTEVTPSGVKWAVYAVLAVILVIVVFALLPFGVVSAGQRGVRFNKGSGAVSVINEGFYFRVPILERVTKMDVQVQKDEVTASAASKDLQTVSSKIAVNFQLEPSQVANVYRDVGVEYKARLIDPALQEAVKSSTAKFTADQLITQREQVKEDIKTHLTERLQPHGILITDINITDFDFSPSFNKAIEAKVTAEQDALASKNKLQQVEYEKQATIAKAQGEAESIRIQGDALAKNPALVELKKVEKWDGKNPDTLITGTAGTFVTVGGK